MAKQADSKNITDVVRNADAASDITFDLEEPLRRIQRAVSTLRLVDSTDGIDPEISDAIYLLTTPLEKDIETVKKGVAKIRLATIRLVPAR